MVVSRIELVWERVELRRVVTSQVEAIALVLENNVVARKS